MAYRPRTGPCSQSGSEAPRRSCMRGVTACHLVLDGAVDPSSDSPRCGCPISYSRSHILQLLAIVVQDGDDRQELEN